MTDETTPQWEPLGDVAHDLGEMLSGLDDGGNPASIQELVDAQMEQLRDRHQMPETLEVREFEFDLTEGWADDEKASVIVSGHSLPLDSVFINDDGKLVLTVLMSLETEAKDEMFTASLLVFRVGDKIEHGKHMYLGTFRHEGMNHLLYITQPKEIEVDPTHN